MERYVNKLFSKDQRTQNYLLFIVCHRVVSPPRPAPPQQITKSQNQPPTKTKYNNQQFVLSSVVKKMFSSSFFFFQQQSTKTKNYSLLSFFFDHLHVAVKKLPSCKILKFQTPVNKIVYYTNNKLKKCLRVIQI